MQMVSVMRIHMVVVDVMRMMIDVVWIMNHLVVDHLRLDQLEDGNGSGQHERQQAQSQRLPRLQGDQSHGQRDQHRSLELQTDQEGDDHLLDDTATC